MKRTPFKPKKFYSLKRTPLKVKSDSFLKKTELNKQNDHAKEKWEEARSRCLLRDNNKCIICGKPATQVHHIHLRSKRKDLLYNLNNLCSLCDRHHFHSGSDGYELQCVIIATKKGISVEELLKQAEQMEE